MLMFYKLLPRNMNLAFYGHYFTHYYLLMVIIIYTHIIYYIIFSLFTLIYTT